MRFRFDQFSRAFLNRCAFDENAQRISVDGRPIWIEMFASFKRKRISVDRVLKIVWPYICLPASMQSHVTLDGGSIL